MSSPFLGRGSRAAAAVLAAAALALVAAPSSLAASAVFGGSTAADEPIVLVADQTAKKLTSAVIALEAKCDDGTIFPWYVRLTATNPTSSPDPRDLAMSRNSRGRFSGEEVAGAVYGAVKASVDVRLSGRLSARRASGSLEATVQIVDSASGAVQNRCRTGPVRWIATRDPGRIYGGATSQEQPVVVRLDRRRRTVADLRIGWATSSCEPPSYFRLGDHLVNFPLRAGRFGATFSDTDDGPNGSKVAVDYQVSGSVSRRAASGRLRVTFTQTDAAGAQMLTCDSGTVSWQARTG
jgi:hypothetical protein